MQKASLVITPHCPAKRPMHSEMLVSTGILPLKPLIEDLSDCPLGVFNSSVTSSCCFSSEVSLLTLSASRLWDEVKLSSRVCEDLKLFFNIVIRSNRFEFCSAALVCITGTDNINKIIIFFIYFPFLYSAMII